jgi:RNA polymerase sigma-70 factor (ECF subfamily)
MDVQSPNARWTRLLELLQPFHHQAAATARRLGYSSADGDDLYQESVLRAFEKLHTLRDEGKFRSWFYAILLSRHRTRARRSWWRRHLGLDEAFSDGREPVGSDGNVTAENAWRARRMAHALATLKPEQREAIVLHEIEGFAVEEVASLQRASLSAVKSRLVRGRERLRRWYERKLDDTEAARRPHAARTARTSRAAYHGGDASAISAPIPVGSYRLVGGEPGDE